MSWDSYPMGKAPNYSRAVESAAQDVTDAEEHMLHILRKAYPLHAKVVVVHHRGSFVGVVEGWDRFGCRVAVRNLRSGKTMKWWAAHVQLAEGVEA